MFGHRSAPQVKAVAAVRECDLRGLRRLAERVADRWVRGVVIYLGRESVPIVERLDAVPVSAPWETPAHS